MSRIGKQGVDAGRRGMGVVRERVVPRIARGLEVGLDRAEERFGQLAT